MPLTPDDHERDAGTLGRQLSRVFSSEFPDVITFAPDDGFGLPRIDVYETQHEVIANCDLPGLHRREDVDVGIDNNTLTISGTVERARQTQQEQMFKEERFTGHFRRSLPLPARVAPDSLTTSYERGILTVRLRKQ